MNDLEVLEMLKKLEEEEVIESYSYYEEEEVKFLIETEDSKLGLRKGRKLDKLFELLDNMNVDYYVLRDEECN